MEHTYRSPLEDDYNNYPSLNPSHWQQSGSSSSPFFNTNKTYRPRSSPYDRPLRQDYPPLSPNEVKQEPTTSLVSYPVLRSGPGLPPRDLVSSPSPKYGSRHKPSQYPSELTDMFGALECKLCNVMVGSPIVAKMHYSGKQHIKKIKNYLQEWSKRTGRPMPEIEEPAAAASVSSLSDFCKLCQVRMTSLSDKMLHYSGKNHQRNERDPANAKIKKKEYLEINLGRFGIGADFEGHKMLGETLTGELEDIVNTKEFLCKLCDVKAVSLEQLQIHLGGKKHKERLEKKNNTVPKPDRPYKCTLCGVGLETRYLYNLHLNGKRHAKSLLKVGLKTTGTDYCDICDLNFKSSEQFLSHVQGKEHEMKLKESTKPTAQVAEETSGITCKLCPFVGNLKGHKCDKSLLNIDYENLEKKFICFPCHSMVFNSRQEYEQHKETRRHVLCILNQEQGEKEVEGLEHFYCNVCKVQYRDNKSFTEHLFLEPHRSLTAQEEGLNIFRCKTCNLFMDEEGEKEHSRDTNHLRKLIEINTLVTLKQLANENIATTSYQCNECNVVLPSFMTFSDHLLSEEHIHCLINKRLRELK